MELIVRIVVLISIFIGFFTLAFYLLGFLERKKKEKKSVKLPFVSIIVPAYNEEDMLEKTVDSLAGLNYPKNKLEIIIVDDGSKDKTSAVAKKLERKYAFVRAFAKKNGGKGSALNFGLKKAKGEIIAGFDVDSFVEKDALLHMIPYFDDSRVMCVTPAMKVLRPKGILQRVQAIEYDLGIFLRKAFANINAVHITPGPLSTFRKEFFDKHGGFDEHNITEDMEVAMRIQSLNYRIENSPNSVVYTIAPNKFFPLLRQRRRWYFGLVKNLLAYRFMFGRKYGELGMIVFPLAVISIFTTMLVTLYYIARGAMDYLSQAKLYSLIGFDFFNNFSFKSYLLMLNIYRMFSEGIVIFGIFFLMATLLTLFIINKKISSIDKPISTFISYVFFIFLYSILFTFWWAVSIFYALTKKEIEW
jgi:cellulose synthase/poly-beta-1,6-N-acetylglucosamine synthase-like glycosyltransferase